MLEVHVILLSLTYFKSRLREQVEHRFELCRVTLRHALVGKHQHGVARQYRRVGVPFLVYGLMSAPQVGVVHKVVVQKRVVVVGLYGACRHYDVLRIVPEQFVCEHHENRTYAFPADRQHISYRLIQCLRLPVSGNSVKTLVYFLQYFV